VGIVRRMREFLRARSVSEDWRASLPVEKDRLFDAAVAELETSYGMLSVALNEALNLHAQGALGHASAQVGISADLFCRLATRLLVPLRALEEHGRHFGTLPSLAPLNAEFFCGQTAQRIARKNHLLSKVLFPTRSRFLHKLRALAEITEELDGEFREAAETIAEGATLYAGDPWRALDALHYDVNTCLRELTVLLKSFLCALPNEEVQPFTQKFETVTEVSPLGSSTPVEKR
jgi:hypothetical protein